MYNFIKRQNETFKITIELSFENVFTVSTILARKRLLEKIVGTPLFCLVRQYIFFIISKAEKNKTFKITIGIRFANVFTPSVLFWQESD